MYCVCGSVCHMCRAPAEARKAISSLDTEYTGGYELPVWVP